MKKFILGLVAASAVALAAPGLASAGGPSDNPTSNDKTGFATANHIHNGYNVDENGVAQNGIGWVRSGQTGAQVSNGAGNRTPDYDQSQYPSISNNG